MNGYLPADLPQRQPSRRSAARFHPLLYLYSSVAAIILASCSYIAREIDHSANKIYGQAANASPSNQDAAFHDTLFVADLHADALLWERDLLGRANVGHVDVPRLRIGNVSLQVFTAVTKTPPERRPFPNTDRHCINGKDLNETGFLFAVQLRPIKTWFDLEQRALFQADRLHRLEEESQADTLCSPGSPYLAIIRAAEDLQALVSARKRGAPVVGALLGLEGVHWLGEEKVTQADAAAGVQRLFDAGFRVIALTHRFDNGLAGSSEGCLGGGLTETGRTVLARAQALGMVVDLAHISSEALQESTKLASAPMIVSHTGVQFDCKLPCYSPRNLSDEDIRAVVRTGGVIGIGYWPEAVGPNGVESILRAMAHVAHVLRAPDFAREMKLKNPGYDAFDYISFGSDFDGAVETPFDASQLALLTAAMRRYHSPEDVSFSDEQIRKIAGGNVCRVFAIRLPGGSIDTARRICGELGG
jgi:membrane dipeptidase